MTAMVGRLRAAWAESYAEWMVILVVAVALAAGWGVKTFAENQVEPYSMAGVDVSYPAGWFASGPAAGVLRFRDTSSGGTPAQIEVRAATAVDAEAAAQALALEADALSLKRARELTAYRVLSSDDARYRGQPALHISYVFVQDESNAFRQELPTVMLGEDLLAYQQGKIYVFSLQAPRGEFGGARRHFQALLGSAAFSTK